MDGQARSRGTGAAREAAAGPTTLADGVPHPTAAAAGGVTGTLCC